MRKPNKSAMSESWGTKERGNDLSTANEQYRFGGLQPGDRWCLCLPRWVEALKEGMAPKVSLKATHISALEFVDLETLREYAVSDEAETNPE